MDNAKTGTFIKELRKEKHLTQKELADLLHVTDRAVSKWERGLCAPDISLLEPLALSLIHIFYCCFFSNGLISNGIHRPNTVSACFPFFSTSTFIWILYDFCC